MPISGNSDRRPCVCFVLTQYILFDSTTAIVAWPKDIASMSIIRPLRSCENFERRGEIADWKKKRLYSSALGIMN